MWKPVWKWLEEVDRRTGRRRRVGAVCRCCATDADGLAASPAAVVARENAAACENAWA
ncbi:MAG TPA: hypothetical protein VGM37_11865 [Armatimonadota bacterium]